jgi:hypothetical protein
LAATQQGAVIGNWMIREGDKECTHDVNFLFFILHKNSALGKYPANYKILLETLKILLAIKKIICRTVSIY